MDRWLARYSERIYAVMRAVIGLLFACHGAQMRGVNEERFIRRAKHDG